MKYKICMAFFFASLLSVNVFADNYPRNYNIDVQHYKFELKLSDSSDQINGTTTITVKFKKDGITEFRLDLVNKSLTNKGRGMEVESVYSNGLKTPFKHENDALLIYLNSASEKDKLVDFIIKYKGIPAGGLKIGPNKYGERCFFNENWPNNTRHWLPTIDHPYDKATSEFIVTAPSRYKVVSNGLLMEESKIDAVNTLTHWKQSVPIASWLFVLGVAEFAVQEVDQFKGKSIQTWVYPKDREAGFKNFSTPTKSVLEFYSNYIGPFAYEKLANIQSPSVSGGMETASAIFYAENLVTGEKSDRLRNVVIHEIAHQWFGNAVTETSWDDAWLSEGFATYFTLLFQESQYGHDEYIDGIKKARKYVIDNYAKDSTFSIVDNRTAETGPVTSGITYQKGAWVLHMLRDRMGTENFKKAIQSYYAKYMNSNATTDNFIAEMEAVANENLKPFFKQWLNNPYILKIDGDWTYDSKAKEIKVNLRQTQFSIFVFDVPVELAVYTSGNNTPIIKRFNLHDKEAGFSIPNMEQPAFIIIDPRNVLLADFNFKQKIN